MDTKILYFIFSVYLNIQTVHMNPSCESHKTCSDCLLDPNICVWCTENTKVLTWPRCRSEKAYDKKWCKGSIEKFDEATATPTDNQNFSSKFKEIVQIRPQKFDVKLRAGKPTNFDFTFQQAENYPVDLYILLDASHSMNEEKVNIVAKSEEMFNNMKKFTNNVRMAFGTYIDKNVLPFQKDVKFNETYSFKHHLNFTEKYMVFQDAVNSMDFGSNRDTLEGAFDALAQVMTCGSKLGWRPVSRKVIVLITDNAIHTAGDGRSANILQPYDGKCHIKNGDYEKELEMDYPSVGTINRLASENQFIICFTLKNDLQEPAYKPLVKTIHGSRMILLMRDKDIAHHLETIYKDISTNLTLEISDTKNTYDIQFDPDCLNDVIKNNCTVNTQRQLKFKGTITLRKYVTNRETMEISIQGVKEKQTLNLQIIHKCNCEESTDHDSVSCNDHGIRKCGICKCDENWFGPNCKCNKNDDASDNVDSELCREPGQEVLCSGTGTCQCGECKCFDNRFGPFCACDYRMCKNHGTEICNGYGDCSCNITSIDRKEYCNCRDGWSGDYCECVNSKDSCKSSMDDKTCNGRGDCICDKCKCHLPAPWDKRIKLDELCRVKSYPEFHGYQCKVVSLCALCHLHSQNCTDTKCDGIIVDKMYEMLPTEDIQDTAWTVCNYNTEAGCYTKAIYKFDDKEYRILLRMQKHQECSQDYYVIGAIVFATIVLVGILTLLGWKLCTYYQDRKEYLKFEKEHRDELSLPCENPLYDTPTTIFRNPAFKSSLNSD